LRVAVLENGTAHFHKITVTRDLGTAVEVSEGVRPGDQVILDPPVNVADGEKVDVRPDTPVPTS
jgi:multidrug efflux pump subunit AcrA (membrane-fusion protein)